MAKIKGFLFTIGFLIFITALFTLVIIVYSTTFQDDKRIAEIGALDNINNLDSSLKNSIKELFLAYSNMAVGTLGTNISFNETLVNNISDFQISLSYLKNFTETNYNIASLNITDLNESLPLIIMPQRIEYKHNYSNREVIITPEELNFNGYHFLITNVNNATCDSASYTNGSFILKLDSNSLTTAQFPDCDFDLSINPNVKNTFSIGSSGPYQNSVTIEISNGGVAKIRSVELNSIPRLHTTVLLNQSTGSQTKLMLPDSIIRISDNILKVFKKDGVRIL